MQAIRPSILRRHTVVGTTSVALGLALFAAPVAAFGAEPVVTDHAGNDGAVTCAEGATRTVVDPPTSGTHAGVAFTITEKTVSFVAGEGTVVQLLSVKGGNGHRLHDFGVDGATSADDLQAGPGEVKPSGKTVLPGISHLTVCTAEAPGDDTGGDDTGGDDTSGDDTGGDTTGDDTGDDTTGGDTGDDTGGDDTGNDTDGDTGGHDTDTDGDDTDTGGDDTDTGGDDTDTGGDETDDGTDGDTDGDDTDGDDTDGDTGGDDTDGDTGDEGSDGETGEDVDTTVLEDGPSGDGTIEGDDGETAAPTGETSPPTGETAAPTGETSAPTGETAAPTGGTAAPTGETAAPTGRSDGEVLGAVTSPSTDEQAAPVRDAATSAPVTGPAELAATGLGTTPTALLAGLLVLLGSAVLRVGGRRTRVEG